MRRFDVVIIGSGIAAYGAITAIADRPSRPSVLVISGEVLNKPAFQMSLLSPVDMRVNWSRTHFGLPAVRAFGDGGTSKLWHGGLFIPHPSDDVVPTVAKCGTSGALDLIEDLARLETSATLLTSGLAPTLREVLAISRRHADATEPWRSVMIPKTPPSLQIRPLTVQAKKSWCTYDDGVVSKAWPSSSGWTLLVARDNGFETVQAGQVLMCAGCLGSLPLLSEMLQEPLDHFSDHLHVFVGVLDKSRIGPALRKRLAPVLHPKLAASKRPLWKVSLTGTDGRQVDVALGFRSVADPNFPRAGRRFGEFIGSRISSVVANTWLGLKNPMTAIEMLGYRRGLELPFNNILVHATIAPRYPVGHIRDRHITFAPPLAVLANAGNRAFTKFCDETGLDTMSSKAFALEEMSSSMISGAQFCAGQQWSHAAGEALSRYGSSLVVCDTSALAFSSIYNQGLLSLVRSYSLATNAFR